MNADAAAPAPREKDYDDKEILDTYFPKDINNIIGKYFKNSIRVFKAHSSKKVTLCTNFLILRLLAVQAPMGSQLAKDCLITFSVLYLNFYIVPTYFMESV